MVFTFLLLCALSEAFLLRFLLELVKEGRDAFREQNSRVWRSNEIESGDLFPMKPESRQ